MIQGCFFSLKRYPKVESAPKYKAGTDSNLLLKKDTNIFVVQNYKFFIFLDPPYFQLSPFSLTYATTSCKQLRSFSARARRSTLAGASLSEQGGLRKINEALRGRARRLRQRPNENVWHFLLRIFFCVGMLNERRRAERRSRTITNGGKPSRGEPRSGESIVFYSVSTGN